MANVNNITIDLSANTANLTVTNGGTVENITYNQTSNNVQFINRPLINISAVDFLNLMAQYIIFQQAILTNFSASIFLTTPFTAVQNVETNDIADNQWNYYCVTSYSPTGRTVDYSAAGSNRTVNLNNRQFATTINFAEWVYLLDALNHYRLSVKAFYNL